MAVCLEQSHVLPSTFKWVSFLDCDWWIHHFVLESKWSKNTFISLSERSSKQIPFQARYSRCFLGLTLRFVSIYFLKNWTINAARFCKHNQNWRRQFGVTLLSLSHLALCCWMRMRDHIQRWQHKIILKSLVGSDLTITVHPRSRV